MEEAEEKIINIVQEEGMVCVLTDKGRIFIQTPYNDEVGNYKWREVNLPDFQNK
jgi:uncharacterized protein (AIM24 family)